MEGDEDETMPEADPPLVGEEVIPKAPATSLHNSDSNRDQNVSISEVSTEKCRFQDWGYFVRNLDGRQEIPGPELDSFAR